MTMQFAGTPDELIEYWSSLYSYIYEYKKQVSDPTELKLIDDYIEKIGDARKNLETSEQYTSAKYLYNEGSKYLIAYDKEYRTINNDLTKAYNDYQEAVASGNEENANKARDNLIEVMNTNKAAIDSISDVGVQDFFYKLYEEWNSIAAQNAFEVKVSADDSQLKSELQGIAKNLGGLNGEQILDLSANNSSGTQDQISATEELKATAEEEGVTIEWLIGLMERLGLIQGSVSDQVNQTTLSFQSLKSIVDSAGDSLDNLKNAISTALDWRNTTEQVQSALDTIYELTGIKLDIDSSNLEDTLNLISSYLSGSEDDFKKYAQVILESLGIKVDPSNIENAIKDLINLAATATGAFGELAKSARDAFIAMGAITYNGGSIPGTFAGGYTPNIDWFNNLFKGSSGSGGSSGSSTDAHLESYNKLVKELQMLRDLDLISEKEYYSRLEALAREYLQGREKYIDEWYSVLKELHEFELKQLEDLKQAELDAAKDAYEAKKKEIENKIDLYNDELDAYKKLIDGKKKTLDRASDERSYDKDVADRNKRIADLKSRIELLSLDDSASAKAERLKLEEELAKETSDLEDAKWDRSVEIQGDALDDEYERYEEFINKQIEALENQLELEEELYNNLITSIENSYSSMLTRIAQEYQAMLDTMNGGSVSGGNGSSSGYSSTVAQLQEFLNGNGSSLKTDGILGSKTIKALQEWLNSVLGTALSTDGILGNQTRSAIAKAIQQGLLDSIFGSLHTGGVVGQTSSSTADRDVISKLIPVSRDELLYKLAKGEVVLNDNQQEAMRQMIGSLANTSILSASAQKATTTPSFTSYGSGAPVTVEVRNVFEGAVDSNTVKRLDTWAEQFKQDIFKTITKYTTLNGRNKVSSF